MGYTVPAEHTDEKKDSVRSWHSFCLRMRPLSRDELFESMPILLLLLPETLDCFDRTDCWFMSSRRSIEPLIELTVLKFRFSFSKDGFEVRFGFLFS